MADLDVPFKIFRGAATKLSFQLQDQNDVDEDLSAMTDAKVQIRRSTTDATVLAGGQKTLGAPITFDVNPSTAVKSIVTLLLAANVTSQLSLGTFITNALVYDGTNWYPSENMYVSVQDSASQ